MPRPLPPVAFPKPEREDFERLLHDLSAQFERLRRRNMELATLNSQLRSRSSSCDEDWLPPDEDGTEAAEDIRGACTALQDDSSAWRGKLEVAPLVQVPQTSMRLPWTDPKFEAKPIFHVAKPCIETVSQGTPSPSSSASCRKRGGKVKPLVRLDSFGAGAASPIRQKGSLGEASHTVSSSPTYRQRRLSEQFRRLDARDTGKLHLSDLARILERAEEPVQRGGLVNLLRVLNDLEPLELEGVEDGGQLDVQAEFEHLWIDFQAFLRLMDNALPLDHLARSIRESAQGLRRACHHEARSYERRDSRSLDKMYVSSNPTRKPEQHAAGFWLETIPTVVILLNTLVIGLSADYDSYEQTWDILEAVFVTFYTIEFGVKLRFYGCMGYFIGVERWWNLFDFACLLISLADTGLKACVLLTESSLTFESTDGFLMVKIFRLARLARLVRTLRFKIFHELKLMVLGVVSGLRVLTWAIVLLVGLVYVVGVAMTNMVGNNELEFSSVEASMFTLFRCYTEGCAAYDGTPLMERLRLDYGVVFMAFHILMTMFVTVGLFNLIMAIFIDNVVTTQMMRKVKEMGEKSNEIELKLKRLFISYINDGTKGNSKLNHSMYQRVLAEVGSWRHSKTKSFSSNRSAINEEWEKLREMNMTVTRDAFKVWLQDEEFAQILEEAEIESANHFELFDVLDADSGGELSMDELTTGLMKLRGPVTKADIVAVLLKVCNVTKILEAALPGLQGQDAERSADGSWGGSLGGDPT